VNRSALRLVRNLAGSGSSPAHWPTGTRAARLAIGRHDATQKLAELAPLLSCLAARRPRSVVEIGTSHGGTLWALLQVSADDAVAVSVDLPGQAGPGGDGDVVRRHARGKQQVRLVAADSHGPEGLAGVREAIAADVDFLFIDGDHSLEGVRMDFETYGPLVKSGGLVAFHDIELARPECGVRQAWDEIKVAYDHREFVDPHDDRWGWGGRWGGIGLLRLP
jgi:predicted O-methyltransferase YrrM